jgi:MFS-type transporter involved in bile tolerance (Atg22 family)
MISGEGCVEKTFSLGGADSAVDLVHYVMYEWAFKVTNVVFNLCFPVLISTLGNRQYGRHQGRIVFAYVIIISAILSSISFVTFTSVLEYGHLKRKALFRFSFATAIFLLLFLLCFHSSVVYLACALAVGAKVSQSIASIAFDSLLDAISVNRNAHSISNRAYVTGFIGLLTFIVLIIPILAALRFAAHVSDLWVQGIIPSAIAGGWYLIFLLRVNAYLPSDLGKGIPFERRFDALAKRVGEGSAIEPADSPMIEPVGQVTNEIEMVEQGESKGGGGEPMPVVIATSSPSADKGQSNSSESLCEKIGTFLIMIRFGLIHGTRMQIENMIQARKFPDVSLFIVAIIFFNISATTVQSVAVIAFLEIFKVGIGYVLLAALIAIITAILGCIFYNHIVTKLKLLTPIQAIITCKLIIGGMLVYALFFKYPYDVLIAVAVGGFHAGPLNAFLRSVISTLIPAKHQSRLFSLYQFSQESTSWIGNVVIAAIAAAYGGSDRVYLNSVVFTSLVAIGIGVPLMASINYDRGFKLRTETDAAEYQEIRAQ